MVREIWKWREIIAGLHVMLPSTTTPPIFPLSIVNHLGSQFGAGSETAGNERAAYIVANLQQVVIEHGPFAQLLVDNSTAFQLAAVEQFSKEWDISMRSVPLTPPVKVLWLGNIDKSQHDQTYCFKRRHFS